MNHNINKTTQLINLGVIEYQEAVEYQKKLFEKIINTKLTNRTLDIKNQFPTKNYLIICEHPHVYTIGKNGDDNNLLMDSLSLRKSNIAFYHTNRGGDITYHGPGQIVVYPILDLDNFFTDIHKYLRLLEEIVIQTLKDYGLSSGRIEGLTGVWVNHHNKQYAKKICAIGVKTSRWVTMHGFALNLEADLNYFSNIVPCGIVDKSVTSLDAEIGQKISINNILPNIKNHFSNQFDMKFSVS